MLRIPAWSYSLPVPNERVKHPPRQEVTVAIQIQETFDVRAAPREVWGYLVDPRRVVTCLPGAELLEVQDERTFVGRVKVKIGPVTASYRGKARFVELDEAAFRVGLEGEGQETSGSGSAKMSMSSEVVALPGGGSQVRVSVDVEVVGRIVQFGRGMIEEVSRQLFRQFAACAQAALAAPAGEAAPVLSAVPAAEPAAAPPAAVTAAPAVALPAASPINALQLLFRTLVEWGRRVLGSWR